jgi:hypothetical protein
MKFSFAVAVAAGVFKVLSGGGIGVVEGRELVSFSSSVVVLLFFCFSSDVKEFRCMDWLPPPPRPEPL